MTDRNKGYRSNSARELLAMGSVRQRIKI